MPTPANVFDATMAHPEVQSLIKVYIINFSPKDDLVRAKLIQNLTRWCADCVKFALSLDYPTFENPAADRQAYLDQTSKLLFDNGIMNTIDAFEVLFHAEFPEPAQHPMTGYMIMRLAQTSTTVAQLLMVGLEPQRQSA